jgi:glycosyltransferase involved in cell wall biosynthesis
MPVGNAERYLAQAVENIFTHSFPDFDLICVDDGPTDSSSEILNRFARQDRRLRVIRRANTGTSGTLNDDLATAAGTFTARMGADDISLPNRLRLQVAHLEAHPRSVIVGSAARAIDADDDPVADMAAVEPHEEIEAQLLVGNSLALIHPFAGIRSEVLRGASSATAPPRPRTWTCCLASVRSGGRRT